eukprot:4081941-Alexandrium_andersonii.AAC.1
MSDWSESEGWTTCASSDDGTNETRELDFDDFMAMHERARQRRRLLRERRCHDLRPIVGAVTPAVDALPFEAIPLSTLEALEAHDRGRDQ